MILTLIEAENLKRLVAEKFSQHIHFHDGCGGQYFTVDTPANEPKKFVEDYFAEKGLKAVFSEDGGSFTVRENR